MAAGNLVPIYRDFGNSIAQPVGQRKQFQVEQIAVLATEQK
jgi:hypothetical protein